MYRITYVLGSQGDLLQKNLKVLLAALTMVDRLYLQTNKGKVLPLYRSGIRYEEEPDGQDDWQDIPTTLAARKGDAEDLACWRAAELQEQGIMAWPTLEYDHCHLHPRVRYPDGRIEDPSHIMGLRKHTKPCLGIRTPGTRETPIVFAMDVFHGSRVPQQQQMLAHRTLRLLLGALTIIDCDILRRYPQLPRLYDPRMAVYYEIEPNGREDWQDVLTNFRRKSADCEDLASHRAAELQVKDGINAWPCFTYRVRQKNGSHLYHIQTRLPDGSVEDPSRVLGMGQNTGI